MYDVVDTAVLTANSKLLKVSAPQIAKRAKPGQFVMVRIGERGERIPLTIADHDPVQGTITIIVQQIGKTSRALAALNVGDAISDVVGPLGVPSEIRKFGTIVCVGGGFGMAAIYPIARALKEAGNRIIAIIGARNEDLLLWEDRMSAVADELLITTDDGSRGRKGRVIDALKEVLADGRRIDLVVAVGPVVMMRAVSNITLPYGVHTVASLNPIMIDGTGLCGGCRVTIDGRNQFVCVDGPDFDAHKVNWEELMSRLTIYQADEKVALEKYQCQACKTG
ncbi:MAG: sulfide/dihydroorotate dehydrogenase-like FAD/NAD-binding protein [Chloroflexi bacterium]|nr:sulfide/dihydroorotate dehydrogenase-like FAD/NAD-binding protein [Chloroflexota bacterium]